MSGSSSLDRRPARLVLQRRGRRPEGTSVIVFSDEMNSIVRTRCYDACAALNGPGWLCPSFWGTGPQGQRQRRRLSTWGWGTGVLAAAAACTARQRERRDRAKARPGPALIARPKSGDCRHERPKRRGAERADTSPWLARRPARAAPLLGERKHPPFGWPELGAFGQVGGRVYGSVPEVSAAGTVAVGVLPDTRRSTPPTPQPRLDGGRRPACGCD